MSACWNIECSKIHFVFPAADFFTTICLPLSSTLSDWLFVLCTQEYQIQISLETTTTANWKNETYAQSLDHPRHCHHHHYHNLSNFIIKSDLTNGHDWWYVHLFLFRLSKHMKLNFVCQTSCFWTDRTGAYNNRSFNCI